MMPEKRFDSLLMNEKVAIEVIDFMEKNGDCILRMIHLLE